MPLRNPGIRDTDRQCRSTLECRASSCDEELALVSAERTRSFGDVVPSLRSNPSAWLHLPVARILAAYAYADAYAWLNTGELWG